MPAAHSMPCPAHICQLSTNTDTITQQVPMHSLWLYVSHQRDHLAQLVNVVFTRDQRAQACHMERSRISEVEPSAASHIPWRARRSHKLDRAANAVPYNCNLLKPHAPASFVHHPILYRPCETRLRGYLFSKSVTHYLTYELCKHKPCRPHINRRSIRPRPIQQLWRSIPTGRDGVCVQGALAGVDWSVGDAEMGCVRQYMRGVLVCDATPAGRDGVCVQRALAGVDWSVGDTGGGCLGAHCINLWQGRAWVRPSQKGRFGGR